MMLEAVFSSTILGNKFNWKVNIEKILFLYSVSLWRNEKLEDLPSCFVIKEISILANNYANRNVPSIYCLTSHSWYFQLTNEPRMFNYKPVCDTYNALFVRRIRGERKESKMRSTEAVKFN